MPVRNCVPAALGLLLLMLLPAPARTDDNDAVIVLEELVLEVEALPAEETEAEGEQAEEPPAPPPPTPPQPPASAPQPAMARTIEREALERRGAEGLDRVLETEPGFVVAETFAGAELTYQGLPGKFSAVTVDGARLPGHIFERVDFGQHSIGGMERVEVIRGPQAAALGPNSAGVVVNLVPRRVVQGREGDLRLGFGSLGYNRQALFAGEADRSSDWSFSLERSERGAYDLNPLFPDTDGDGFTRLNAAWDYRRRFGTAPQHEAADEFALRFEHFREETSGRGFSPPNLVRHLDGFTTRRRAIAGYTWRIGACDALELSHNWGSYSHGIERYFPEFPDTLQQTAFTETLNDTRLSWQRDGPIRWQAGLEHGLDQLSSDRIAGGAARATQSAAYVIWSREPETAAWRLDAALRLDHHDEFGTHLSPKLGAGFRLDEYSTLSLGAGRGYRAPSLRERNYEFASPFGYTVLGNPDLRPESSTSLSADFERRDSLTRIALGVFRHEVDGLIVFDETQAVPQVFRTENVGDALSSGVQYGLERRWTTGRRCECRVDEGRPPYFGLGFDGVWLAQSRDGELGTRLAQAPRLDQRVRAFYEAQQWDAEASWHSVGARYLDRENTSQAPGYAVMDLSLGLRAGDGRWRISALNALDEKDGRFGPKPGRELRLEFGVGF